MPAKKDRYWLIINNEILPFSSINAICLYTGTGIETFNKHRDKAIAQGKKYFEHKGMQFWLEAPELKKKKEKIKLKTTEKKLLLPGARFEFATWE